MARNHSSNAVIAAFIALAAVGASAAASPDQDSAIADTPSPCRGCPTGSIMTPWCFDDPCNLDKSGSENTQRDPWACRCVFEQQQQKDDDNDNDENDEPSSSSNDHQEVCQGCPTFYELNFWCMNDPCNLIAKQQVPEVFRCKCRMQTPVLVVIVLASSLCFIATAVFVVRRIRVHYCPKPQGEEIDTKKPVLGSVALNTNVFAFYANDDHGAENFSTTPKEDNIELKDIALLSDDDSSTADISSSAVSSLRSSSTTTLDREDAGEVAPLRLLEDDDDADEDKNDPQQLSPSSSQSASLSPSYQPPTLDHPQK